MDRASLPPRSPLAAPSAARGAVHLPLDLSLAQRRPLVVELLATGRADLELGATLLEVDPQRNQGQAALGDLASEAADLASVEQQFAITLGIVIGVGAMTVGADVAAEQPDLVVSHRRIRVLESDQAGAKRLDLGPPQHESRLDRLEDLVLVPCTPVARDGAIAVPLTAHRWSVL